VQWRLRLAEFDYVVQTRPGASHHVADTMSRNSTPAVDDGAIPDAVPCVALLNSAAAWQLPPQTEGGLLSPLTLAELLEGQAADGRCKEVRAAIDGSNKSRFHEDPKGLLVRVAPLDGSTQVYVLTHISDGVMMRDHSPPQAGHPGANKMYTSMRRWFDSESMLVDVYAFVAKCTQCARNRVGKRRKTNYLKTFPPTERLTDLCTDLLDPLPRTSAGNEHLLVIVDRFSKMTRAIPSSGSTRRASRQPFWTTGWQPTNHERLCCPTTAPSSGPRFSKGFAHSSGSPTGTSRRIIRRRMAKWNGTTEPSWVSCGRSSGITKTAEMSSCRC